MKGVAVYRVLYQSILNAKLTGRKKLGRKRCTSNRDDRKLENTVKQSWFKHLGELHKEWTEAGVSASRVTTLRHLQEKGYQATSETKQRQKHLTWAKEKKNWTVDQWSKVLFSDKSTFCISFGNQGPRVWRKSGEAQNPSCLKSSVKFLKSVMIWGAVTSAGVGPLCFIKSKVKAAVYQEILEHFMLRSADKLYGDADFLLQQDFSTCPQCQNHFIPKKLTFSRYSHFLRCTCIQYIYIYIYIILYLYGSKFIIYMKSLFAKTDKHHFFKKRADCRTLFSTYSAIWTLNTFCQKSWYCPLSSHREFTFYCRSRQAPLLFFEQKPIRPF